MWDCLLGMIPAELNMSQYDIITTMAKNLPLEERSRLRNLAAFRYELRRFLQFSESRAEAAGLPPQQHQLLLQIAGAQEETEATVSYAADRLGLRHHTVVELSKRCEEAGLIHRNQDMNDRRCIRLELTVKGYRILRALSEDHARELYELAPRLIGTLSAICGPVKRNPRTDKSSSITRGHSK
jgi:DNA-binding MarR family transcriptional regulator